MSYTSGRKNLTADGAVGTSKAADDAYPIRVYCVSVVAGIGTAATVALHDGNDTTGSLQLRLHALASSQTVEDIATGLLFPNGCYVNLTGAGQTACVGYVQEAG